MPAYVVMPSNAPAVKKQAVRGYGASIIECEPTLRAREAAAAALLERTGATLVHPYDDPWVIAGQGTAALELSTQAARPDVILVPVGGGGLLSGTALAVRELWPGTRIVGVEPEGADDATRSFRAGKRLAGASPQTIADGLRGELSERTFALISGHVDDIVTVSEEAILEAMRLVWRLLKVVIEPSAAVPVAALLEGRLRARTAAIVLSGGNADFDALAPLLACTPAR
jgi:threonine dehydratase